MSKVYKITPVAKPRMTRSDKWKKRPCVMKYRAYCDELRKSGAKIDGFMIDLHVCFSLPMPKSWSEKKKKEMRYRPHRQVPDLDNLIKGLQDALLDDDAHISSLYATKIWDYEGSVWIG